MRSAWNSPWPPGPGARSAASSRQLSGITKTAQSDRDQRRDQGQVVEP